MEKREIKAGDVVCLKSGSPKMVVAYVNDGVANVMWFPRGESAVLEFGDEHVNVSALELVTE